MHGALPWDVAAHISRAAVRRAIRPAMSAAAPLAGAGLAMGADKAYTHRHAHT
jgi:hypothetical protein